MTDLGVAAKLRAAFELSPTILAVTALDAGFDPHLTKPVEPARLQALIAGA